MIRPSRYSDSQAASIWMVTFADLVLLLLAFFVMLFSMTGLDAAVLREITGPHAQRLDAALDAETQPVTVESNLPSLVRAQGASLPWLREVLGRGLSGEPLLADTGVALSDRPGRLVIAIPLIESAGQPPNAALSDQSMRALVDLLNRVENKVVVVGHAAQLSSLPTTPLEADVRDGPGAFAPSLMVAAMLADRLVVAGFDRALDLRGHGAAFRNQSAAEIHILEDGLVGRPGGLP